MSCLNCKSAFVEDAGRGRSFLRCGKNGRVIDVFPSEYTPELTWLPNGKPAWCDGEQVPSWTIKRWMEY